MSSILLSIEHLVSTLIEHKEIVSATAAYTAKNEGLRTKIYTDTTGHPTWGYGWNLNIGIPQPIAAYALNYFLQDNYRELLAHAPWIADLSNNRQTALLDMAYNLGIQGLFGLYSFMGYCQKGLWADANQDLRRTAYARQVGGRALRNAQMIEEG